jgi:Skp family chaperone for outer membrane proteins
MKYLSFKIVILCILLPPVVYIFSVQSLETRLKNRYTSEIENIYTGDTDALLEGSISIRDSINKNINLYLQSKSLILWGVDVKVTVTTKRGTILYPAFFENDATSLLQPDPIQIANENYNLMNEELILNVDLKVGHNTLISNTILIFYIFVSLIILYYHYRSGLIKAKQDDIKKEKEIDRLLGLKKIYTEKLMTLGQDRKKLTSEAKKIKNQMEDEKEKASRNEDEMIKEIVFLEKETETNLALQIKQQEEIDSLKEKINRYTKSLQKESRQKTKNYPSIKKRFNTIYKNLSINERAINGFIDLTDDMKIKVEEIIHQLNEDPKLVSIKRKVFGKKGHETVLEVIFAYKGRLYYRKTKDNKIEVLVIGTKNTQVKDLEFLEKI